MEYKMLKHTAEQIKMPKEMKHRISSNVRSLQSKKEYTVNKHRRDAFFKKPAAVFAALAICVSVSITAMAATGMKQGFFRDIKNWCGAIVGTSYEQADDEINLRVGVNGDTLTALVVFSDPREFPYREIEKLGIAAYQIVDAAGNVVKKGESPEASPVVKGQATITIPLNGIACGSFKLVVSAFVAEKKAEQPLTINGTWECSFSR